MQIGRLKPTTEMLLYSLATLHEKMTIKVYLTDVNASERYEEHERSHKCEARAHAYYCCAIQASSIPGNLPNRFTFTNYAINLLLPFHYRIRRSVEWSISISLCLWLERRYCAAGFVAADPNAFAVVCGADVDDCDGGGDDGFVGAE